MHLIHEGLNSSEVMGSGALNQRLMKSGANARTFYGVCTPQIAGVIDCAGSARLFIREHPRVPLRRLQVRARLFGSLSLVFALFGPGVASSLRERRRTGVPIWRRPECDLPRASVLGERGAPQLRASPTD